jgi:aryl-alcohol dehydrogenase-like predicted oxidoreductase
MEIRRVGASGLQVSRLGLGTMTWGRDTPDTEARALLEMFCAAGGTLIDTAAAYGAGDAERLIGKLVSEVTRREEMVIATKAGFVIRGGKRIVDTSRRALLRAGHVTSGSPTSSVGRPHRPRPGSMRCPVGLRS